jgi:hypothetical protein
MANETLTNQALPPKKWNSSFFRRHDIQHNVTQYNDTQQTQHNELICNTQHK